MTSEHKQRIAAANAARRGETRPCPEGCTCNKHKAHYRGGSKVGRKFSDAARQNISEGAQKRERSAEEMQLLSEQMKANHTDPEWEAARIVALQLARTGTRCQDGCTCRNHLEEVRHGHAEDRRGTFQSEETKAKISATLRQMLLDGTWEPGKTQPALYVRGGVFITMRSAWEVDFAEVLDRHGIVWIYEPKRFDLGWTTYMPDFLLPAQNLYIEVKGYLREKAARKMVDFQTQGHRLALVTYHPSERGLSNPVPEQIQLVLGPQVESFVLYL